MKRLACIAAALAAFAPWTQAQVKRYRQDGLQASFSSSTAGAGNVDLALFGRTFLWDNDAAQRIPPAMPHLEVNYGLQEWLDVSAGINPVSYVLRPGYMYFRAKGTPFSNRSLRLFGAAGILEARRQFLTYFPSNGYRVKSEGFGPEGFIAGNDALFTSFRALLALDMECILLSSHLPFKLYLNAGWDGAYASYIDEDNRERFRLAGRPAPDQSFAKIPLSAGAELKTFSTDFFLEAEAEPFLANLLALGRNPQGWVRIRMINKVFDHSVWESPALLHIGARLKYAGGLQLQGGFSWLLSADLGASLGPCHAVSNPCKEGATDGFSPFYPQWKLFAQLRYPLRFTQTSSELYRSLLLRRYGEGDKRVDVERTLRGKDAEAEEAERKRRLDARRKEADAKALELD